MSSVEEWAKPALIPLINGTASFLDHDSQGAVATWIAMKTMVAEYLDPSKVAITLGERQFLRDQRLAPSANWRIWIGNYERTKWAGQWVHGSHGLTSEIVSQSETRKSRYANYDIRSRKALCSRIQQRDYQPRQPSLARPEGHRQDGPRLAIEEDFIAWPTNALDDSDADVMASAIFVRLKARSFRAYEFAGAPAGNGGRMARGIWSYVKYSCWWYRHCEEP